MIQKLNKGYGEENGRINGKNGKQLIINKRINNRGITPKNGKNR
jgi:hypothetical protein